MFAKVLTRRACVREGVFWRVIRFFFSCVFFLFFKGSFRESKNKNREVLYVIAGA